MALCIGASLAGAGTIGVRDAAFLGSAKAAATGLQPPQDMLAWYKADAITGKSHNDNLAEWLNVAPSAYALNATQGTAGNQPFYLTNMLNGLPVVDFRNTNTAAAAPRWFELPQYYTNEVSGEYFVVCASRVDPGTGTSAGSWFFAGGTTPNNNSAPNTTGDFQDNFMWTSSINYFDPAAAGAMTNWQLISVWATNAQSVAYFNGQAFTNVAGSFTNGASNPSTGRRMGRNGTASQGYNGFIAEWIVYGRVLSDAERDAVEAYVANKYGLTIP